MKKFNFQKNKSVQLNVRVTDEVDEHIKDIASIEGVEVVEVVR